MENKVTFEKEKVSVISKISNILLKDIDLTLGLDQDDFMDDISTLRLDAWYLSNLSEVKKVKFKCDRPSFLDWLLRRQKTAEFTLVVKDILLNPPKLADNTVRFYEISNDIIDEKQL